MKIDDLLRRRAGELRMAYTKPALQSPPAPTRGFRIRVALAAALTVILLAVPIALFRSGNGNSLGQPETEPPGSRQETTTPPTSIPSTTAGLIEDVAPPVGIEGPYPHSANTDTDSEELATTFGDPIATPARRLLQRSFAGITFRLSERPSEAGRCLEVTAVVNDVVHSRGGTCDLFGNPSSTAWDLERPIRFSVNDKDLVVFFGRAGSDVATVRVTGPVDVADTQVSEAWLAVSEVAGELPEIVVASYAPDGSLLMSEAVPMEPVHTGGPLKSATLLDVDGLLAELQIAGATAARVPTANVLGSPFDGGEPSRVCVNGYTLMVYEYHEEAFAKWDSRDITAEGQLPGPGVSPADEWGGTPRFFAAGRLIVLHLNNDPTITGLLTDVLGPTLSPDAMEQNGDGYPPCEA